MKQLLLDKVLLWNGGVLATISFLEIEAILKLVLLILSITYTIVKMLKGSEGNPQINNCISNFFDTYFGRFKKNREDKK